MNWFSELSVIRDWPPLALPFAVAFAGELLLAGLMIRSREDRRRLLVSAVLLPLHVLMYLLVFHPPWEFFIEIYVFFRPGPCARPDRVPVHFVPPETDESLSLDCRDRLGALLRVRRVPGRLYGPDGAGFPPLSPGDADQCRVFLVFCSIPPCHFARKVV